MKNKKWISLAAAVVLAVTALPAGVFAAKRDGTEEKLTKVTLNEVAHSIFYAPQYVAIEEGYFEEEGLDLTLVTGFGADKVLTALISGEADIGSGSIHLCLSGRGNRSGCELRPADPTRGKFSCCKRRDAGFQVGRSERKESSWRAKRRHAGNGI